MNRLVAGAASPSPEPMGGRRLGLIVNPVAGLGGRVGLKGSDGLAIQRRARALGAKPQSATRAAEALRELASLREQIVLFCYPGEMGEDAAREAGFSPQLIGSITPGATTADDTRRAAREMRRHRVELLLLAGGDGTARDMVEAIGQAVPVVGIPAGVKVQSAVYAVNAASAGRLAARVLRGQTADLRECEVVDLDEEAYRQGALSPRLYGALSVPFERRLLQARKSPTPLSAQAAMEAIALDVVEGMQPGVLYIIGPGTTTRPILARLSLTKTLIGVDVVQDHRLVAADANEADLLRLARTVPARIIVTPIGGQGFLFGRGNQQISPAVIRAVGREAIVVVSALEKLLALGGQPLLVDTGDAEVDRALAGPVRVITGYGERMVYRVQAPLRELGEG